MQMLRKINVRLPNRIDVYAHSHIGMHSENRLICIEIGIEAAELCIRLSIGHNCSVYMCVCVVGIASVIRRVCRLILTAILNVSTIITYSINISLAKWIYPLCDMENAAKITLYVGI